MSHTPHTTTTKSTTKRPTYRGKYPHRVCMVASGHMPNSDGNGWTACYFVRLNCGTELALAPIDALTLFGPDRLPRLGSEFDVLRAFLLGIVDTISDSGATLTRTADAYVMHGATGTHTIDRAQSSAGRVSAHWAAFVDAHRAARAAAKRPPFIRDTRRPQWTANSAEVHALLGLPRTAKLPAAGMPARTVDGVTVYVRPLSTDPAERKHRPHRVRAICPLCGADISAGRLHQHRCAPL